MEFHIKAKPSVEGTVGKVTSSIIARLRKEEFNSVIEANEKIRKCLEDFNAKPFQKRNGSRKEIFENEEKMFLRPLPKEPYEFAVWKQATVQYNYHIFLHFPAPSLRGHKYIIKLKSTKTLVCLSI